MTTQDAQDFLMAAMMSAGLVLGVVMLLLVSERLNRWLDDRSEKKAKTDESTLTRMAP